MESDFPMTFQELEQTLPNGFHDATIIELRLNGIVGNVTITLSLHVSADSDLDRERYRIGRLRANSVCLFFIEPPDPRYHFALDRKGIGTSGDSVVIGQIPALDSLIQTLPPDSTAYRFFLEDWNSFLYLAAKDVEFFWDDDYQSQ